MVASNEKICPNCGGNLKYHGLVKRIVRAKCGKVRWVKIRRLLCADCGSVHRGIPNFLVPYKHYEAPIITGVISGAITSYDLDYEDYPCEMTMIRWKKLKTTEFWQV